MEANYSKENDFLGAKNATVSSSGESWTFPGRNPGMGRLRVRQNDVTGDLVVSGSCTYRPTSVSRLFLCKSNEQCYVYRRMEISPFPLFRGKGWG
jgi:hypothetical protein